ncbi:hypothetical protein [Thermomonospora cellulosilytica]|uniref:Glycosyltransferase RgtA/B/C/D-like domain-containing protein n=1 Tax=Thermomonospora cellulosilytica TaxID=1411118 RepID=A0A7W3N5J3_9ACTN|nr:hypothetical protein [Thermomonospora cellulosilytica]MBA9007943.1 hypothetical protein [Thermomonospora cellulosilytica]
MDEREQLSTRPPREAGRRASSGLRLPNPFPNDPRALGNSTRAGRVLARLTIAPALLIVAWLAVSLPLLMAGAYGLGPSLALFVPVAFLVLKAGFWDRTRLELTIGLRGRVSWWVTASVVAVAAAFFALEVAMCAEQVVVRRDPASYVQFATWLNEHGSLPIDPMREAFGSGDRYLDYGGPAFYEDGGWIVPQFMAGLPMVLALGGWLGGTGAMLLMAPLLGAGAVLSFGGLTARLVGPRWAPVGALALALTLPMQWLARSTYSELPALVLLLGGLSLLVDVRELESRAARVRAFLAGLSLGLVLLVRIDGIRDLLPVVVFAGLLAARRRPTWLPLTLGLGLGAGAGLLEGYTKSRPYLEYLGDSLRPALLLAAAVIAGTVLMAVLLRWGPTGLRLRRLGAAISRGPLPSLAAAGTVLVVAAFAARPLVQTVRRAPRTEEDRINVEFVEQMQRINGLPIDGWRQYTEQSLYWVIWYIGLPALLLAALGAAVLTRRLLKRRTGEWVLPFMMIAWSTVTILYRPGITPDHPWASRRLVALVLPGLLLLALWGTAWCVRRVRFSRWRRAAMPVALAGALAVTVPIAVTAWPLMLTPTEQGELRAVRDMCRKIGPGRSVVIVDPVVADRLAQVVRGMCGIPAARPAPGVKDRDFERILDGIRETGRRPAVLGATPGQVSSHGAAERVLHLRTRQDERSLVSPPNGTWPLSMEVWMSEPAP